MTPIEAPSDRNRDDDDGSPHRSRLLSFLRQQILHWRDRYQVAARQARSAGVWGVQLLFYPAYWLLRGSRQILGDRESTAPKRSLAAVEMEPAMMEVVATAATGLADAIAPTTKIDAIACDLANRAPVAIAADGRVIELPKTLQQELQATLARVQPQRHWLTRFMDWMRAGPLARGSKFARPESPSTALQAHSLTATERSLSDLWSPPTPEEPFSLQVLLQSAIAYFFGPRATQRFEAEADTEPQSELPRAADSQSFPASELPESLPWLAYEDLFPSNLPPAAPKQATNPEVDRQGTHDETHPAQPEGLELGGTDLFLSALPFTAGSTEPVRGADIAAASDAAVAPEPAATVPGAPATIAIPEAAAIAAPAETAPEEASNDSDLDLLSSANPADDPSEYLNVRVVASRYIKHPLEVIVDGLDRILAWLEDWVIGLWKRLRGWVVGLFGGS